MGWCHKVGAIQPIIILSLSRLVTYWPDFDALRIGTELKKILDNFVFSKKMTKPLLIMVITDEGVSPC